jgi:hypothetical protein
MKDATQHRATRPGHMATGGNLTSRPSSQHRATRPGHMATGGSLTSRHFGICWLATSPSSPYLPHAHPTAYMLQHLTSLMQVFMALHDETYRSPPRQNAAFSHALFFRSDLPGAHFNLSSDLQTWCVSFLKVLEFSGAYPPSWWLLVRIDPPFMPRPRGRSRRGAAWYRARGREPPPSVQSRAAQNPSPTISPHCTSASPPPLAPMDAQPPGEVFPPPLTRLVVPSPSKPKVDPETGLSPLSNPFSCRIEWFDLMGNSIGYAPPPPSPPRHPFLPPPPPPSRPRSFALIPSPGLFFLLPSLPPPSPLNFRDAERAELLTTLDSIKKELEDIKTAMREVQSREDDRWRRVDNVMAFLQDLRRAMADREKGKAQVAQVYAGPRLGPGH